MRGEEWVGEIREFKAILYALILVDAHDTMHFPKTHRTINYKE